MIGHRTSMAHDGSRSDHVPLISVIMANFEGGTCLADTLKSVTRQSIQDIEIIVSDDASRDDSVAQVRVAMLLDPRIRLVEAPENGGPARARNRALAQARGKWIAIVDADDLIHPERFERLLAIAESERADIVADDLLHFYEDGSPSHYLLPDNSTAMRTISPVDWISAGSHGTSTLGYLKPMIRAEILGDLRYDETLRIGEDYALILRLLVQGVVFKLAPEPWYLYRRHARSVSHRLKSADVLAMITSERRFVDSGVPFSPAVRETLARRIHGLESVHAFAQLVENIKRGAVALSVAGIVRRPGLLLRVGKAAVERMSRTSRTAVRPAGVSDSSRPIVLAANAPEARQPDSDVVTVPAYRPTDAQLLASAEGREVWRNVADLARGGTTRFVATGKAGLYAAGFIPFGRDLIAADSIGPAAPDLVETL